jgi:TetR/AcrR family transcriptional repressor of bet genes
MEAIRRRQIRKAASRVVAKRGFDGTTLMHVARMAGTSTGTISHYYENKLAMLVDALVYVSEGFQTRMKEAVAREAAAPDKLRALIRVGIFDTSKEAMVGHAVWIWALAEGIRSKALLDVIQERRRLFQALLADVIGRLGMSARMAETEVNELAAEYDAYFCGLSYHLVTGELKIDQAAVERSLLSMALARVAQPNGVERPAAALDPFELLAR